MRKVRSGQPGGSVIRTVWVPAAVRPCARGRGAWENTGSEKTKRRGGAHWQRIMLTTNRFANGTLSAFMHLSKDEDKEEGRLNRE